MTGRPASDAPDAAYHRAVAGWAAALREGSTTSWASWLTGDRPDDAGPPPAGPRALDATHLEVVRRLNLTVAAEDGRGGPDLPAPADLADLVLATAAPGRGMLEPPLAFPGREPRIGTPPRDPEELPAEELLRVVAAVLVRLVGGLAPRPAASAPPVPVRPAERVRRAVAWRVRAAAGRVSARRGGPSSQQARPSGPAGPPGPLGFEVHGSPGLAGETAARLVASGSRQGGPDAVHLVLVGPLDRMLVDLWQLRAEEGTGVRWERFCDHLATQRRLPRRLSPAALAAAAAQRRGPERVHVLLVRDADQAVELAAPLLGIVAPAAGSVVLTPPDGSVADLLRTVDLMLGAAVRDAERAAYQPVLRRLVADAALARAPVPASAALHVPETVLPWAQDAAARLDAALREGGRAAGYAVHGDPGVLMPATGEDVARGVDADQTLQLGLTACAGAWRETGRSPEPT